MIRFFLTVYLSVFTFSAYADFAGDVDLLVEKYNRRRAFHGNILVKRHGEVLYEKSIGDALVEWSVPHTRDSKFMVASLSKSFTAAMILILQNQGKLSIEDSVADYIDLPEGHKVDLERWNKLIIKDLMSHRGVLKRNFSRAKYLSRTDYNFTKAILKAYFLEEDVFVGDQAPGEKFMYSNLGYLMLAEIIETAGVGFYENQLRNKIFRPLRMLSTGEFHRSKHIPNMSDGYYYGERQTLRKRCCDDATALRGAASLYSTTSDLMIWLESLQNSVEVFGFDLLGQMMAEAREGLNGALYGFGLERSNVGETYRISHTGHEWGYISSMSFYPKEGLEIVVLSNRHEFYGFDGGVSAVDELSLEVVDAFWSSID